MTPEEARRVHLRLRSSQAFAPRNRKREWGTLLHGGLARCAYCGGVLSAWEAKERKPDGSEGRWLYYICARSSRGGLGVCRGARIRADALDFAVQETLNRTVSRGNLLQRVFETWDRDKEAAMASVRRIEQLYNETKAKVDNSAARLAAYAVDDPAAAPVEATMRMYAEQLPGLLRQRENAARAVTKARNNTALRDELNEWFSAWMHGWQMLSRERQRQFLFALKATVRVWRTGDRVPQAQLQVGLPTSALDLPSAPGVSVADDGVWQADVEAAEGAELAAYERQPLILLDETGKEVQRGHASETAHEMMAAIYEELSDLYPDPAPDELEDSLVLRTIGEDVVEGEVEEERDDDGDGLRNRHLQAHLLAQRE